MSDDPGTGAPRRHERYERLIAAARELKPTRTAVVHPCNEVSLESAIEAQRLGLIDPILVGPAARIREEAAEAGLDLGALPIIDAAHSHDSAAKAVEQVRLGQAEALMKGSLHTDELMGAVVAREGGIRTARRISHCFVMDVPGHADPLIITDAAINIAPTFDRKGRYRAERDRPRACLALRGSAGGDPERHGDHQPQGALDAGGRRAVQDGRPRPDHRARCWTGRWRSTTPSAPRPPRSRASSRRSPDGRTCWWCPIWKPATCW